MFLVKKLSQEPSVRSDSGPGNVIDYRFTLLIIDLGPSRCCLWRCVAHPLFPEFRETLPPVYANEKYVSLSTLGRLRKKRFKVSSRYQHVVLDDGRGSSGSRCTGICALLRSKLVDQFALDSASARERSRLSTPWIHLMWLSISEGGNKLRSGNGGSGLGLKLI